MKKVLAILLIFLAVALIGCSKEITAEDKLYCKEGKYSPSKEQEQTAKEKGMPIDYIRIASNGNKCIIRTVLKKPVNLLGTEIKSFDKVCYKDCMIDTLKIKDEQDLTMYDILTYCCDE